MNLTFTGNQNLISLVAKGSEVLLESLDLPDGSLLLNLEEIPAGQEAFLKKEGESVEDAKKRLAEEQKEREETAKGVGKPNIPQQ